MLNAADMRRVLGECGDGIEVKADGRTLLTAQIEGTDPKYLNLVSQPEGVRLPDNPIATQEPPSTPEIAPAPVVDADPGDTSTDLI